MCRSGRLKDGRAREYGLVSLLVSDICVCVASGLVGDLSIDPVISLAKGPVDAPNEDIGLEFRTDSLFAV